MRLQWMFVTSLLMMLCLIPLATWAQGGDPETWPTVYQDNFDDPTSGWAVEETEQAAKGYVDGAYEIKVQTRSRMTWSQIPRDSDFLDFAAEVDGQVMESTGEFGFLFRYVDSGNFYCFTICADGRYRLRMRKNDFWQTLVKWTSCEGFESGVANHLKLIAQGETFSFLLNERLVTKVTDATFRGGQIALAVGTVDSPKVNVRFDNLVVRADPVLQESLDQAKSLRHQVMYGQWNSESLDALFQQALQTYEDLGWKEKLASTLILRGFYQYSLAGEDQKEIECYKQSLVIYQQLGNKKGEAGVLLRLGNSYAGLTQYEQAIIYYEQSLAISREIGDRQGEASSLRSLGECYRGLGEYEKAINYYKLSIKVYEAISDMLGEASSLRSLGDCYGFLGRYTEAMECFKQSAALLAVDDKAGTGCMLYYSLGEYERAISCCEGSLAINRQTGNRAHEAEDLRNLGKCYYSLAYYERAIAYCEQSLLIYEELGDTCHAAICLNDLGNYNRSLGSYERSLEYYETSLNLWWQCPYRDIYTDFLGAETVWGNMSQCYLFLGDNNRALEYAMAAAARENERLAVLPTQWRRWSQPRVLNNVGVCYFALHNYELAITYYRKSLDIAKEIVDPDSQVDSLIALGDCYISLQKYEESAQAYKQALSIISAVGGVETKWKAQWGLGKAYWKQGELTQAKKFYEEAITAVEGVRSRIKVEKLEQSYTASVRNLYEEYIELLLEMGEGKDTLSADERARARAFLDALAASPAGISKKTIEAGIANGIDSAAIKNAVQTVVKESPRESAILEYLVTNQGTLVWVIRGGEQHGPYKIPHGRKELTDKVIECRQQIEQLNPMANLDLAILYDWLIRPIEGLLPPSDANHHPHLIIVPSGPLYYLPFQALIWTSTDLNEHSYFIERYALSYSPSLTMIKYEQLPEEQSVSKSMFVALANPNPDPSNQKMRLPEAQKEAYRVAACFPVAKVYVGRDANEDVLGTAALGAQSILFAAHGIFDPNNPMYSYVALSPTKNTDGRLHAYDVFNLSLDTDTVVLSACETLLPAVKNLNQQMANVAARTGTQPSGVTTNQLVTITAGDDIVGLTRAFLIAGASSVISSLWDVDSKAAGQLMISFYHHLEDDEMTKAEALRAASLDIMNDSNWNLPCYWAPFELIGGWQ